MSLMAVFNCSFLVTLILFLLIIGLIWIHFNQKINEQNIKMNQMVYLLTTTTQEIALLRKKIGLSEPEEVIDISNPLVDDEKINVSDCESSDEDSDEDSEEDSDEDSDASSESTENDSEEDEKLESDSESEEEDEIKKIQLKENEQEGGDIEIESEDCEVLDIDELQNIKKIVLTDETFEEETLEEVKLEEEKDVNEGKEEKQETNEKEDYKKMSLNKLKSLVLEKKLVSDVSKLKKNELLTILGIE